jgi:hypothetical protein
MREIDAYMAKLQQIENQRLMGANASQVAAREQAYKERF